MSKFDDIKAEYTELAELVAKYAGEASRDELQRYVLSASLRIWGSNGLYSADYADTLEALSGNRYTVEQMLTAMSCCADTGRTLLVPAFFRKIAEQDADKGTEVANKLGELLVSAASINGDFTIEEANALSAILHQLSSCCANSADIVVSGRVTPRNEESYLRRSAPASEQPKTPEPAKPVVSNTSDIFPIHNSPEPETDDIPTLEVKIELVLPEEPLTDDTITTEESVTAAPETVPAKPAEPAGDETLDGLLAELDGLVGLESVKRDVHSLMNFIKVSKMREARGMKVPTVSYHLVFTGNPGTGKTTVARLVAQLYYRMGILPQGQLVETDRSALVAGYLGQTAIKTQKVIQQALGGVLFIDEAYSLAGETDDSYGREAIETILKAMEDHRDELVVIVAGYDELMHKFIDSNPGLASRFSKYFHFPDYDGDELLRIFLRFCETNGYSVDAEVIDSLRRRFADMYLEREEHFGNARTVRNIFEKAINRQADRVAQLGSITDDDLVRLSREDIDLAMEEA